MSRTDVSSWALTKPLSGQNAFVLDLNDVSIGWGEFVTDREVAELTESHGGRAEAGWWDRVRPHSLGWVTARLDGSLVGFVNVAWDGGDHAFLLDTKTRRDLQRQGIGTAVVLRARDEARAAGCEWLHVDSEEALRSFYLDSTHSGCRVGMGGEVRRRCSPTPLRVPVGLVERRP